jgi:hypothetical protein
MSKILENIRSEQQHYANFDHSLSKKAKMIADHIETIEQENKMMKECLEMICLDNIYIGQDGWKDEYFLVVKNAKECLNKLTKDKE